jgi:Mn-dependent transcriptional regulator
MHITPAERNYLYAVKKLQSAQASVKAVHLARYLHVSKPSVSTMLRQLKKDGLVNVSETSGERRITLSEKGEAEAGRIKMHRTALERMFLMLGAPADAAEKDAATVEPYLSDETYSALCSVQ